MRIFDILPTSDKELEELQNRLANFFEQIRTVQLLDGTLIKNIELKAGIPNNINHKLSRKPLGYIVTRKRAKSDIWDSQDSNKISDRTLILHCDADVRIDLWIF